MTEKAESSFVNVKGIIHSIDELAKAGIEKEDIESFREMLNKLQTNLEASNEG